MDCAVNPALSISVALPSDAFLTFIPLHFIFFPPTSLYRRALMVQLYLRIDRLDLAQKEQKAMKALDEDNALTMLASAWVGLATVSAYTCVLSLLYLRVALRTGVCSG
jgi:hypothetical protein